MTTTPAYVAGEKWLDDSRSANVLNFMYVPFMLFFARIAVYAACGNAVLCLEEMRSSPGVYRDIPVTNFLCSHAVIGSSLWDKGFVRKCTPVGERTKLDC